MLHKKAGLKFCKKIKMMANKKQIMTVLLFLWPFFSGAQSVSDLWLSMPLSMTPYLSLNQKKEMIECHNIGVDSSVHNQFQGETSIDTLTSDF